MIRYLLLLPIFVFLILGSFLFFKLGLYKSVPISIEKDFPGFWGIFLEHQGAYHKIGDKFKAIEKWAKKEGINCNRTYGYYLDNPKHTEEGRLRSHAGCITKRPPPDNHPEPYHWEKISRGKYLTATFTGSPSAGPLKVYPKLKAYAKKNALKLEKKALEVYSSSDSKGKVQTTRYYFRILE